MAKDEERFRQEEELRRRMYKADKKPSLNQKSTGCFPQGTLIATPYGLRDIFTLKEGDHVTTFDSGSDVPRTRRILRKLAHREQRLWKLHFSDGAVLRTTSSHCFHVNNKWVRASSLSPGATVTCIDDHKLKTKLVVQSGASSEFESVYNLIVDGCFTFVANGVLAHSFSYLRNIRKLAWMIIMTLEAVLKRVRHNPSRGLRVLEETSALNRRLQESLIA